MNYFIFISLGFFTIALVLILYVLLSATIKKSRRRKRAKWKNMCDLVVRNAIFSESRQPNEPIRITLRMQKLLGNRNFRKLLTHRLLVARKNILGPSSLPLKHLYLQLGLDQYALKQLMGPHWHRKAMALQEIGLMDLKDLLAKIYRYSNHKNELVRGEAQVAIIKLYGFEGLRFLDVISYQLTSWQQIKLLNELSLLPAENFNGIEKWMQSTNWSVVLFSLKLAGTYRRFELYSYVLPHLESPEENIRLEAINCLRKWESEESMKYLLMFFPQETLTNQLAIARAFQFIATREDIPQLIELLSTPHNELRRSLIRSIAKIDMDTFRNLKQAEMTDSVLLSIIQQVEGEQV